MSNRNPSGDSPLKDPAAAFGERAADTVNEGREAGADGVDSAASSVRDRADQLPGGPKVQEFAHATAERLSSTADYMRSHDAAGVMRDIEGMVRNNPGPALAVAAAFGFLLGKALSRD
jgi:ElaB/YqjD/DUF883 family membrane-anchored ribosome-binding protein